MQQLIISLALSTVGAIVLTLCSLKTLQMYQLSSYQAGGFVGYLKRSGEDYFTRLFSLAFFQFVSLLIFNFSFPGADEYFKYLGMILYIAIGIYFIVLQLRQKQKTPLVYTKRIIRQLIVLPIIYFGLCFLSVYFTFNLAIGYSLLACLALFIPLIVTISHFIALPIEKLIASYYKGKAAKALKNSSIIRIGITGSYGKTTAKKILNAMLSKKYKVLYSPASHNTPMGISKLINAGLADSEVFIAEMGARHRGDIKELCDLVKPDYGIITAVGLQHLETFGSIDTVLSTKMELAHGTKGEVVINSDDIRLMNAAADYRREGGYLYAGQSGANASFTDISLSADGVEFVLNIGCESIKIKTQLLGAHIPPLITQCAALAYKLDISLNDIAAACAELQPIQHRLQLIKTEHGAVIDDAYNSNPLGAANALEVLRMFEGKRVVITPGFVELGGIETSENKKLGEKVATTANYLISVGNPDIAEGASAAGMLKESIFIEPSLDKAMERLALLNLEKPTVLFLNDLPDNY